MTTRERLARIIDVHPGEQRLVFLLMAMAFCLGLVRLLSQTASNTLFLVSFGIERLPYVYIVAALTVPVIGALYTRLESRVALPHLVMGTLGALFVMLVSILIALAFFAPRWPSFALAVWFEAAWAMTGVALWGLVGRLLNVRQGKRLFSLISVGDVVAAMLGGFATPALVIRFGIKSLLVGALIGLAGALGLVMYMSRMFAGPLAGATDEEEAEADTLTAVASGRHYVMLILTLALVSYISFYFIDYIFYNSVQSYFPHETELASFLGVYWASVNLLMLGSKLFFARWMIERHGVRNAILILPVLTLGPAVALAAVGTFFPFAGPIFFIAALISLFDWSVRESVFQSSLLTLYQPLPAAQRLRIQALAESVCLPAGEGVAGMALIGFSMLGFGIAQPSYMLIAMLLVCIALAVPLGRQYAAVVIRMLGKRQLSADTLIRPGLGRHTLAGSIGLDDSVMSKLVEAMAQPHPGPALYALALLEESDHPALRDVLLRALDHPAPLVRQDALTRIERLGQASALESVRQCLAVEDDPAVRAAALPVLARLDPDGALEQISPYLDDPDWEIRRAAVVGLLRSGGLDGMLAAGERLYHLMDDSEPAARATAAQILGDVGIGRYDQPLLKLLDDPHPAVRRSALQATGKLKSERLWPRVIAALAQPDSQSNAMDALAAGGEAVLPHLKALLAQPELSHGIIVCVTRVAGRIQAAEALALLLDELASPDADIRHQVLLALRRRGYKSTESERTLLQQCLRSEIEAATRHLVARIDMEGCDAGVLLRTALDEEVTRNRECVLLLLASLYDPAVVWRVRDNLALASLDKHAYELEALDTLLPHALKLLVFPLLEDLSPDARLQRLSAVLSVPRMDQRARLREISTSVNQGYSAWTRACAIYALAEEPIAEEVAVLATIANSPDRLVRDATRWMLAQIAASTHGMAGIAEKGVINMLSIIEKVLILKTVTIFAATPDHALAEIAGLLEEVHLSAGKTLFSQGDPGRTMYIIVDGRVRVHVGERLLNYLGERDILGEMAVLGSGRRTASVTAVEETQLLRLDQDALYELMADRVDVARGIIQVLCDRLGERIQDIEGLRRELQPFHERDSAESK